jgi:NAD(P)-dependent dehydrogenase (short-subunit alcohol dehydrogenase family)
MELGLKGRAVAITGGSKGIGRVIPKALAQGVNVVLLARGPYANGPQLVIDGGMSANPRPA